MKISVILDGEIFNPVCLENNINGKNYISAYMKNGAIYCMCYDQRHSYRYDTGFFKFKKYLANNIKNNYVFVNSDKLSEVIDTIEKNKIFFDIAPVLSRDDRNNVKLDGYNVYFENKKILAKFKLIW